MKVIPEIRLEIKPMTSEAASAIGFAWADTRVGKRSKIGGRPDLLQEEDQVICDVCRSEMVFYAQIDSVGDEICLADAGMVFVFVCFDCFTSKSHIQSA
ncbi:MAG: hypothetical protein QNJ20_04820 [Paracoccaceae bacterium]|nr:hypothetical protein [Paracoccaceae bacterium]